MAAAAGSWNDATSGAANASAASCVGCSARSVASAGICSTKLKIAAGPSDAASRLAHMGASADGLASVLVYGEEANAGTTDDGANPRLAAGVAELAAGVDVAGARKGRLIVAAVGPAKLRGDAAAAEGSSAGGMNHSTKLGNPSGCTATGAAQGAKAEETAGAAHGSCELGANEGVVAAPPTTGASKLRAIDATPTLG